MSQVNDLIRMNQDTQRENDRLHAEVKRLKAEIADLKEHYVGTPLTEVTEPPIVFNSPVEIKRR